MARWEQGVPWLLNYEPEKRSGKSYRKAVSEAVKTLISATHFPSPSTFPTQTTGKTIRRTHGSRVHHRFP
jgi:hypothetical protein